MQTGDKLPVEPFKLNRETAKKPSSFEVIFIHEKIRYEYGVSLNRERVFEEWLIAYPNEIQQNWFSREYLPDNPKFERNSLNTNGLYIDPDSEIQVSYMLDFDNFNTDIRTIPEFSTLTDVDYLAEAHALCAGYKDLYTESAKQRVAEVFAQDIATWNYTF
jgi:hypothetical protein